MVKARSIERLIVAAILALALALSLSGCAAVGGALGGLTAGFVDGLRKPSSVVELHNAVVQTAPRVLEDGKDRGSVHLQIARTGGVTSDLYCPPELAAKCLGLRPGQILKGVKGELTEARPVTSAGFARAEATAAGKAGPKAESLAGVVPIELETEAQYEEARLAGRVPNAGPAAPHDAILVWKINPRKQ